MEQEGLSYIVYIINNNTILDAYRPLEREAKTEIMNTVGRPQIFSCSALIENGWKPSGVCLNFVNSVFMFSIHISIK